MARTASRSRILASVLLLGACTPGSDSGVGDDEHASFGGGKADGLLTDCERVEVVKFVNASTTDRTVLRDLGLRGNAADGVLAQREGADGELGTADDSRIADLGQLDDVPFVGPVSLEVLVGAIADRCEVDLATRPAIDAKTFDGSQAGSFARDNTELEVAMTVLGISGVELFHVLATEDDDGRTGFSNVRRSRDMEAFTLGYPIDEIPWGRSAHAVRESMPFMPLRIESGRFEADDDGGERELRLGTDVMDDFYFDTSDYRLLANDVLLRGRVRWDDADNVRRLLIAAKFDSAVGEDGVKRASKMDVRTFGGAHKDTLVEDIRRGKVGWDGGLAAVEPIEAAYAALEDAGALQSVDGRDDLMLIDPKLFIRSVRSRYHLDLPSRSALIDVLDHGVSRIERVLELAESALSDPAVDPGSRGDIEALIAAGTALLDHTAIADAARAELLALDPNLVVEPGSFALPAKFSSGVDTHLELEINRVVAETVDAQYHAFSEQIDDVDRALTATRGLDGDELVDMFITWQKSVDTSLDAKTVALPFLLVYEELDALSAADRELQWDAFADFARVAQNEGDDDFEDFEALDDERWEALGRHLRFDVLRFSRRQIEAAGTIGHAVWFDQARDFYVPSSSRPVGNFLIDTMDFAQMLAPEEWDSMSDAQRRIDTPLDPRRILHSTLVNEVQIELGFEDEYLERIEELEARIAGGGSAEDVRDLDGARFVFERFNDAMRTVASLKEDDVLDELEDLGARGDLRWDSASHGKGSLGLLMLTHSL